MIAKCPTCEARYKVADEKVSPGGTKFKCKKCKTTFTVYREAPGGSSDTPVHRGPTMRNCPHCGKPIPAQAVKCRWCREDVAPPAEGEGGEEGFAPEGGYAQEGECEDPFVPQGGAGAFEEEEGGFGGGASGYGGPTPAQSPRVGGYQQTAMPAGGVPNYLVYAILTTLFCCLPFGIVAIVYAAQVNGKLSGGDVSGAMESSRKAKMWSWISFGVGLPLSIIYIVLQVLGALATNH